MTGVFAPAMADRLVPITPGLQASIDVVLIGIDETAVGDRGLDDRPDRRLLHIGQHVQHDLAATLQQAEDRRLLLLQRPATRRALQPSPPPGATFWATASGRPLCPATTYTSSISTSPSRVTGGIRAVSPARNCSVMTCTSDTLRSSSRAICRFDKLRPIK